MTVPFINAARLVMPKIDRPDIESFVHIVPRIIGTIQVKRTGRKQQALMWVGAAPPLLLDGVTAQIQKMHPTCALLTQVQVST
jgi:hypothetical protein